MLALVALAALVPAIAVGAGPSWTQAEGAAGCLARGGLQRCAVGRDLKSILSLALSPDDRSLYAASLTGAQLSAFERDPATGGLTASAGRDGCFSQLPLGSPACATGRVIEASTDVVVSPDGRNVYVASLNGVTVFDRDAASGALREKRGRAGCLSDEGPFGVCASARDLRLPESVAISPDGRHVYVAAQRALVIFDRDPRSGSLRQKRGRSGCFSARAGCARARGFGGIDEITVSADGTSLYARSFEPHGLAVFDRARNGTLRQKRGRRGCVSRSGTRGTCIRVRELDRPQAMSVSRDGRHLYVVAGGLDTLVVFRRMANGELRPARGRARCIAVDRPRGACRGGRGLAGAADIAIAPDNVTVAVAAFDSDAIALLERDLRTGTLVHRAGPEGCFAATANGCTRGRGLGGAGTVAFSGDGNNLYVASTDDDALAIFRR